MKEKIELVQREIKKAVSGKDEVIEQVLTAILASGHILLEDIPGVGKTTLALSISKALGLKFGRVQFTPDVVPSDITGFSIYDKASQTFSYKDGAVMTNFFLADEINRTSSKTQSALLQVMQEGVVTVDGVSHKVPQPFIVMATQNPVGTAGTQMLPEAQLDRFMIKISMGYPDAEAQVEILKQREKTDPIDSIQAVVTEEEIIAMKEEVKNLFVDEKIYRYITSLCEASRNNEYIRLGISPRGALSIANMAKANAYMEGRDFVTPEDVKKIFPASTRHRIILSTKAGAKEREGDSLLLEILESINAPKLN